MRLGGAGDTHVHTGINAAAGSASACLVHDGAVVAAAEEERFTGVRPARLHLPFSPWQLPFHAIEFCLARENISLSGLAATAIAGVPQSMPCEQAPPALRDLLCESGAGVPYQQHFVERQCAREAAACLPSPFNESAVLVLNGSGGGDPGQPGASYGVMDGDGYRRIGALGAPHAIGRLYDDISVHLGFSRGDSDGRLAALAPCGRPGFVPLFRDALHYIGDGQYRALAMDWTEVLGPPRLAGQALEQRHMDIAHSLQRVLEDTVLHMAGWLHQQTGQRNLCLAGSVTLNCLLNTALRSRSPFEQLWLPPAAGNSGTAMGAALLVDHQHGPGRARRVIEHAFTGPAFTDAAIEQALIQSKLAYRQCADIARDTAALLAQDKIVGWFQGAMEYGPRGLGARSILAAPFDVAMQERLQAVKGRDDVRMVAAVVPEQAAADWFACGGPSPFMSFVDRVRPQVAGRIAGACHVDGSARLQTVTPGQHALFHEVIDSFGRLTGVPVLLNTSLNLCGEPMVHTPRDALALFGSSPLDALAIGSFLLEKSWLTAWRGTSA
jgi:carbamoyltransferase